MRISCGTEGLFCYCWTAIPKEEQRKAIFQNFVGRVLEGPGAAQQLEARKSYARALCAGAVEALAFCHSRGVAHGALASNCVYLSTIDWWDHRRYESRCGASPRIKFLAIFW